ncbi:MAG: chemotaxis protein CheD [Desulfuromonadales bacterium]
MKKLIASHIHNLYLKPGEVLVVHKPALISTVLGSCIAVTMFSPARGIGAICHAMLPDNSGRDQDLRYVDTALRYIFRALAECGAGNNPVVKLFGGAQVLDTGGSESSRRTVGEQNVARALEVLDALGLSVSSSDTGGCAGRKLYFCTRDGDVYVRRMRHNK